MFELFFGLVIISVVLTAMLFLSWAATQLGFRMFVPFIFSSFFWLMAAINLRDAATKVEPTGCRRDRFERLANLTHAIGLLCSTTPFFIRDCRYPLRIIFGSIAFAVIGGGIFHGLSAWCRSRHTP